MEDKNTHAKEDFYGYCREEFCELWLESVGKTPEEIKKLWESWDFDVRDVEVQADGRISLMFRRKQ